MIKSSSKRFVTGVVALLALSAGVAIAQETPKSAAPAGGYDPKAKAIVDKYVEVTGGKEAYEKLKTRKLTMSLVVKGQNVTGKVTVLGKVPNMLHVEQEISGMGGSQQGFDGKVAWEKNPMTGNRVLDGEELKQFEERAFFNVATEPEKVYPTIRFAGEETINGKVADKIEMINDAGTTTQYFDRESGLIVMQKSIIKSPMGEIPVTMTFADYKEVDGIKVAYTMVQDMGMAVVEMKVEDLKHNVEVDDAVFAVPADMKK